MWISFLFKFSAKISSFNFKLLGSNFVKLFIPLKQVETNSNFFFLDNHLALENTCLIEILSIFFVVFLIFEYHRDIWNDASLQVSLKHFGRKGVDQNSFLNRLERRKTSVWRAIQTVAKRFGFSEFPAIKWINFGRVNAKFLVCSKFLQTLWIIKQSFIHCSAFDFKNSQPSLVNQVGWVHYACSTRCSDMFPFIAMRLLFLRWLKLRRWWCRSKKRFSHCKLICCLNERRWLVLW